MRGNFHVQFLQGGMGSNIPYRPYLTDVRMRVKIPPLRRQVTLYLTTLGRLGNLWGEAGIRAQSGLKQIRFPGANGETARVNKTWKSILLVSSNLNNKC